MSDSIYGIHYAGLSVYRPLVGYPGRMSGLTIIVSGSVNLLSAKP